MVQACFVKRLHSSERSPCVAQNPSLLFRTDCLQGTASQMLEVYKVFYPKFGRYISKQEMSGSENPQSLISASCSGRIFQLKGKAKRRHEQAAKRWQHLLPENFARPLCGQHISQTWEEDIQPPYARSNGLAYQNCRLSDMLNIS